MDLEFESAILQWGTINWISYNYEHHDWPLPPKKGWLIKAKHKNICSIISFIRSKKEGEKPTLLRNACREGETTSTMQENDYLWEKESDFFHGKSYGGQLMECWHVLLPDLGGRYMVVTLYISCTYIIVHISCTPSTVPGI